MRIRLIHIKNVRQGDGGSERTLCPAGRGGDGMQSALELREALKGLIEEEMSE